MQIAAKFDHFECFTHISCNIAYKYIIPGCIQLGFLI